MFSTGCKNAILLSVVCVHSTAPTLKEQGSLVFVKYYYNLAGDIKSARPPGLNLGYTSYGRNALPLNVCGGVSSSMCWETICCK